jgi:predicted DCC family thiol-disulfide oxidoreductase YuxK
MGPVVFFDGVCNLCNQSVDFIIKRDTGNNFLFASLQSEAARSLLKNKSIDLQSIRTIILLKDGKTFYRSDAILEIVRQLSAPWPLLYVFKIVPRFIRDGMYNLVSKHRYNWFGKQDTCRVPSKEERARFLEEENGISPNFR